MTGSTKRLPPAHLLARQLLDRHGLGQVRVELTDMGDHYDPRAKAMRQNRVRVRARSQPGRGDNGTRMRSVVPCRTPPATSLFDCTWVWHGPRG